MRLHLRNDSPYLVARYNWIEAAITAAGAIGSAIGNGISTYKNNMRQEAWTREQFDYNKQLNKQIMEREDTAYQRAVADAKAAGLSPLTVAGTGGAGAGGSVSQSNLGMNTEAFQIEPNTLADAMRALQQENMQKRQLSAQSSEHDKDLSHDTIKFQAEIDSQMEMLDKKIAADSSSQDKALAQDWRKFDTQLQFTIDSRNASALEQSSRDLVDYAKSIGVSNFEYFEDEEEYRQALKSRCSNLMQNFSKSYEAEMISSEGYENYSVSDNASSGSTTSGSVNSSLGVPNVVGVSSSLDASGTSSSGDSHTRSGNAFQSATHKSVADTFKDKGFPVFVGKVKKHY